MSVSKQLICLTSNTKIVKNKLEKNDIITKLTELTDKIVMADIDNKKLSLLLYDLEEYCTKVDSILDLDINLNQWMYETKKNHEIYPEHSFHEKLNEIGDDSLIIYIKKAQLYKVYNADDLDDFINDDNVCYTKKQNGPAYEVVRDTNPQKLMIVIKDNIRNDKIFDIKENIIEFIKKTYTTSTSNVANLKVYATNDNTEFVVSSVQFKDLQAKESFIEDFIIYMRKKGDIEIANKIELRPPPSDLKGARYYELPSVKKLIDGTPVVNFLDQLITTSTQQKTPVVIQNNTFIFNNNNGNVTNNIVSANKTNKNIKKTVKTFCKDIYDNKPEWYKENQFVDIEIIEDAYRKYFNTDANRIIISRSLKDNLFTKTVRSGGITKKKLYAYDVLKKLL